MDKFPKRKTTRLKDFDYSTNGAYFITVCTKNRKCILSHIAPRRDRPPGRSVNDLPDVSQGGLPDGLQLILTKYGKIADKYINQLNDFYDHVSVMDYVIMPNHIHFLLYVNGPSGTPVPTASSPQNSVTAKFISTFKRFCNKEYGENIWQYRSYDHVVRDEADYTEHLKYIRENPACWQDDDLFSKQ